MLVSFLADESMYYNWVSGSILPFVLTILPLVLSPGPDTLVILRNTLSSGKLIGFAAVVGVQCGLVVHLTLALIGISLFIVSFPNLYSALVLVGAAYLAWLGTQGFRQRGSMKLDKNKKKVGWKNSAVTAAMTNLLNPKVLVLFFTLLPGFVMLDLPIAVNIQLLQLVSALIFVNFIWQTSLVIFINAMSNWLFSPKVNRMLAKGCGVAMMFFALLLIYEHNW